MDLFSQAFEKQKQAKSPLASRMRPRTLEELLGQEELLGEGKLLRRAIEADHLTSLIFYGPPGTGKTTVARIIAGITKSEFAQLNAVTSGVADIRKVIQEASERLAHYGRRTILFIDEIHRFNKSQQDALLPSVEEGTIILIGATTENPYFTVNSALLSRSQIFCLKPLGEEQIGHLIERALSDEERGLGQYRVEITPEAMEHLISMSGGDARRSLTALELAVLSTPPGEGGVRRIDLSVIEESIQRRAVLYDKDGDQHYDTVSAFIKSMRGSDPDAAVYWLARMLYAGEDPLFIARRILICASEDVGMADPQALVVANATYQAVQNLGMPEGRIPLSQAAVYVACAPKSNASYMAINEALRDVEKVPISGVPVHLRDASYKGARNFGHGKDYLYAHDYPGHYVKQQYLPDELKDRAYYQPTDNGFEKVVKNTLNSHREG